MVELAPLADSALVTQSIAAALGVRDQIGRPIIEALVLALIETVLKRADV